MNEVRIKRTSTQSDLAAALDKTVEAAVALGLSEYEVLCQLSQRMHSKTAPDELPRQRQKKMYNPEAGP